MWYDTAKRGLLHEIAVFVLPALLLGLTACGAPVAAVTLPDTVQVEKTQTAETAVLYEDADGREVSPAAPP